MKISWIHLANRLKNGTTFSQSYGSTVYVDFITFIFFVLQIVLPIQVELKDDESIDIFCIGLQVSIV